MTISINTKVGFPRFGASVVAPIAQKNGTTEAPSFLSDREKQLSPEPSCPRDNPVSINIQNGTMEDSGPSRENLTWTENQMDYLVQLLVEQSRIPGMKSGGGLKPKAYTAIEKLMIKRFGVEFTKDKIKNKLKYTKPNLTVMKEMLNTSGFGYDPINKCIQVDAQVWNDYIQRYPSRKKYRGPKVWRYYDEFAETDHHLEGLFIHFEMLADLLSNLCFTVILEIVWTYSVWKDRNLLEDARDITVEEQVAMLLLTIGHNERNRAVQNTFQHSGQTITICTLGKDYVRRSNDEVPASIRHSKRFFPYFENCLGAIDGTHIPAWVLASDQARYRNRKGFVSQNVMTVVGLDTRFHYVLAGWEGSATDSRVLYSALDHETYPFIVPEGKYYLADGGYPNIQGLLTPYRGHRYHMSEFSTRGARSPRTREELFNHRHSSLRNTVERTFGMLKGRFPIYRYKGVVFKSFDSLEVAENHKYEYVQKKYGVQVSRPPLIEDVTAKQDIEDTKCATRIILAKDQSNMLSLSQEKRGS
ncbi:hypothetical protein EJ110_NYTH05917 [Nymphaea thermarum]|nr:hypothetical protein EJ110_NYTH05917 [Nymphaea thermarum]